VQYNFVSDRTASVDRNYNEFWVETYIRFW
jgi:hypothetical protein